MFGQKSTLHALFWEFNSLSHYRERLALGNKQNYSRFTLASSDTFLLINDQMIYGVWLDIECIATTVLTTTHTFVFRAVMSVCSGELLMHGCTVGTGFFVCGVQKCPACLFPHNSTAWSCNTRWQAVHSEGSRKQQLTQQQQLIERDKY